MARHDNVRAKLLHGLITTVALAATLTLQAHAQNATATASGVSPTGAFTYNIPVRLPPGTAGVQPSISLTYNSQGGNGLAGVGWNLTGVSVITRCPRTMAVDGVRGGVNIDANDRLCLDGQRLIYHSGGSGYGTGGAVYFTEVFNGSKVVQLGGTASIMMIRPGTINRNLMAAASPVPTAESLTSPSTLPAAKATLQTDGLAAAGGVLNAGTVDPGSGTVRFRVYTKAGEVMEYIDAPYNTVAGGSSGVRMWLLSRVSDVKTNYFDFVYNYDDSLGEYNVDRIRYTGNSANGLAPYNEVRFSYESRPDTTYAYLGGARLSSTKRLTTISTWYTPSGGNSLARVSLYQLAYDQSPTTQRSRLRSVVESADDPSTGTIKSLNPIAFEYTQDAVSPPDGWGGNWASGPMDWGFAAGRGWVDMFGTGRAGFCRQVGSPGNYRLVCNGSTGSGLTTAVASQPMPINPDVGGSYADINGDGMLDFCAVSASYGSGQSVSCYLGPISTWMSVYTTSNIDIGFADGRAFVDVDGDGRADLCRITGTNYAGSSYLRCRLSDGNTFTTETGPGGGIDPGFDSNASGDLRSMRYWADVNGDGLADFCRGTGSYNPNFVLRCSLAPDFDPAKDITINTDHGFAGPGRQFVDINGDGKADFCRIVGVSPTFYLQCALSTGTGFVETILGWGGPGNGVLSDPGYTEGRGWTDVNGDGLPDFCRIVGVGPYRTTCRLSPAYTTDVDVSQYVDAGYQDTRDYADPVGDGRGRFCRLIGGTNFTANNAICTGVALSSTDSIKSVTSGLGLTTAIQSAPLPSLAADRFQKTGAWTYPQQSVVPPMFVVKDLVASVPGGTVTSSFGYVNAISDARGRGFGGFQSQFSWNDKTFVRSQTWTNLSWPFAGTPAMQFTSQPNGAATISGTETTYQSFTLNPVAGTWTAGCSGGQICTVAPSVVISRSWDLNRAALPQSRTTTTVDGYGNPISVLAETLTGMPETFSGGYPTGTSPLGNATGYRKTTTNVYMNDVSNWWIGRLLRSTVTSEKPAD